MTPFKINIAVCAGNTLEWCDFIIYSQLSLIIAPHFFPSHNIYHSLILFFLTYFITYAMRPLGGLTLARVADKFGRRKMLLISAGLMSGCSVIIALLPTYQSIGTTAPVLLVFLRLLQALAISVEFPTAISYQIERTTSKKTLLASIVQSSVFSGVVIASILVTLVSRIVPKDLMAIWGWRIPLLILGLLGISLLILRLRLPETKEFEQSNDQRTPAGVNSQVSKKTLFFAFLVPAAGAAGVGFLTYQVTYLSVLLHKSLYKVTLSNLIVHLLIVVCIPISALLLSKWPLKSVLKVNLYVLIMLSLPLFFSMQGQSMFRIVITECVFALALTPFISMNVTYFATMLAVKQRVHNVAFVYNLSIAVFGATVPLVALILKKSFFHPWGLGIYFMIICILSLTGVIYVQPDNKG